MPSTGKLCVLLILACILGPIAAGYLLPSGESEEKTGYTESNPVNISQDLYNNTEPYSAIYTGYANNSNWYSSPYNAHPMHYVSVSQTYGSIRAWTSTYTPVNVGNQTTATLTWDNFFKYFGTGTKAVIVADENTTIRVNGERELNNLEYVGGDSYATAFVTQYPVKDISVEVNSNQTVQYLRFDQVGYADPAAGTYITNGWWRNFLQNESIDMVFRDAGSGYNFYIGGFNGNEQRINLVRSGPAVTAYFMQNVEEEWTEVSSVSVGNYRDVLVRFTIADSGAVTIEVSGLSYAANVGDDVQNRIVNLMTLQGPIAPAENWDIPYRQSLSLYAPSAQYDKAIVYVDSVTYTAGSYSVMLNSSLNPALYFPAPLSCSAELRSISQYGDSITLPGAANANLPITGGYVTITGTENGETVTKDVKLRELTVLAVYDEDTQLYSCYIGNTLLGQQAAPTITLNGAWLLSAYVYKTEAYSYTTLEWDLGTFNLDQTGFCLVGLLCSFVAFVGLGLWGRRSGGKVAALAFVALLCAFVYLTILMEA